MGDFASMESSYLDGGDDPFEAASEAGWLDPDDAHEWMRVILSVAPSHQGGHSDIGKAISEIIGTGFPLTMDGLTTRAVEMKYDPDELWPWLAKMRAGRQS